ncbi:putative membrane protein [Pseudonocardia sediminis]|uniref:Putative membrane protein n=1 Tax=Pseudonocardia sediminis TaxID=1397368 RepID=A0A4Q7UT21_PSEST|nr:DUF2243 domain-containing protein [Pseudonocardia sediminis]RZT84942.1 putative membrane protein [Pseudonocardia sediminis]
MSRPTGRPADPPPVPSDAARPVGSGKRVLRINLLCGFLLGMGVVAFVDEAVFHQILHWHHFYDRGTSAAGLVSDGVFHAFSWFATVASLLVLARLRAEGSLRPRWVTGGLLVGAGLFQLYDGLVHHKLLGLHEIRYGVDLTPYDLVWNGVAVVLLVAGLVLVARSRAVADRPPR